MARVLGDAGPLLVRALLNVIIGDIIQFVNVGKTMTGPQLTETVGLVLKHYSHLKPEDFKLCFEGVKKGNYGPLYDRIDGQVILSWLKAYDSERDYVAAEINSNRNEEFKMQLNVPLLPESIKPSDTNYDETFKTNLAKLRENLEENKKAREADKLTKAPERPIDPIAAMHQRWLKQFDAIWKRQRYPEKRQIMRYGMLKNPFWFPNNNSDWRPKLIKRKLDVNAYLEHKQWQYVLALTPADQRMNQYLLKYPKK